MCIQCALALGFVLQGSGGLTVKQKHQFTQSEGLGVIRGAMHQFQSSYLACCLQRGQRGQWTTQLEELLDKLKEETNKKKNMILQLNKHVMSEN